MSHNMLLLITYCQVIIIQLTVAKVGVSDISIINIIIVTEL